MKSLSEISKRYDLFESRYGIAIADAQQGSEMWQTLKLGVISASNVSKVVAKKGSETRNTYMAELVAQVCTGVFEEINSKYLEWGSFHEDAARSYYEFSTGNVVKELPFVFKDDSFRTGCSPDGIVSDSRGVEIKCPFNAVHFVKFLVEDKIKSEYVWQYQYSLWVMDATHWDFVQYHPSMKKNPMKILTVEKDEKIFKIFDELIPKFIEDLDKMLAKAGFRFGEQWERLNNEAKI